MITKKQKYSLFVLICSLCLLSGCSMKDGGNYYATPTPDSWEGQMPRLVVKGKISDMNGEVLEGIRVDLYGVREATEEDLRGYNYALSDSSGVYIIARYRGRQLPTTLTLVATDPSGKYQEQTQYLQPAELLTADEQENINKTVVFTVNWTMFE